MRKLLAIGAGVCSAVALLLFSTDAALAYPSYAGNGCVQCHTGFVGRGPLHDLHVGPNQMTNNCYLCHGASFESPLTYTSGADPNHGCDGCHVGPGLRLNHAGRVDPNGKVCTDCHTNDPTPEPENTLPPYYSRGDVNLSQPCAIGRNNGGEDYDGNLKGLDNDGDGDYDFHDSDCVGVATRERSWGVVKSRYGTP